MTEPIFDHERLDVYCLAIAYVSSSYRIGKTNLKRIVSMLTRLIQRTEKVSEGSTERVRVRARVPQS